MDEDEAEQDKKSRKLPCYMYLNGCEKSSATHKFSYNYNISLICSVIVLLAFKLTL